MSLRAIVKEVIAEQLAMDAPPKVETAFDIEAAIDRFVKGRAMEFPDEALHLIYWLRAFLSGIPEVSVPLLEQPLPESKPDPGWLTVPDEPTIKRRPADETYFLPTDQIETLTSPTEEMIQ